MLLFNRHVDTKRSILTIGGSILGAFGSLWVFVAIANFYFAESEWFATFKSCSWPAFVFTGCVLGIARLPKLPLVRVADTDVLVGLQIGNMFKCKGAYIIGCNSTFDTSMEDGTISKKSIQGQFTELFCDSVSELDQKLKHRLRGLPVAEELSDEDKPYGNKNRYNMGTTLPIESSGNKAYFVAIATLNRHGVASVKQTDLLEALPIMWNQIRSKGNNEDILCPILGSRFARLNLDRTRLIHAIVRSFIAATREGKLTERLTIVIHPRDYRETSLCMEELARFVECECRYLSEPVVTDNAQPRGTMLE